MDATSKLATLHRAYFAEAGEAAARYGITFGQIVEHLQSARPNARRVAYDRVRHLSDLVHAVACVHDVSLAWTDLSQLYEPWLVRVCRSRAMENDPIVLVRRLLRDLHRRNRAAATPDQPSLRIYVGSYALRSWLTDRVLGFVRRETGMSSRWRVPAGVTAEHFVL
jgi:hypothetical protein